MPLTKVALHGVPRSGTSWIGEILNSSPYTLYKFQPLFSYAFKNFLSLASTSDDIHNFFEAISRTDDAFINQTDKRASGAYPSFNKRKSTHIIYKEVRYMNILFNMFRKCDEVYLIAVVRNPMSTINSWLKAPREFRRDLKWLPQDEWRYARKKNMNKPEEYNGYEKWKEATNVFHQLKNLYPSRVNIIRYSRMLAHPIEETQKLFASIDLEMCNSTREFIVKSNNTDNQDPYSVFRYSQRDDKWKTELDPHIAESIIKDLEGTPLQKYLEE